MKGEEKEPLTFERPSKSLCVFIDYTNWKGERRVREVSPVNISFTRTEHHPKTEWILRAWDVEKRAYRDFAMKNIHSWSPA